MFHPLSENLENLKDDELQERINSLSRKYATASRMPDQSLLMQVQTMLTMYRDEQQRRYRNQLQKQKPQKDNDQDLGDLINVN